MAITDIKKFLDQSGVSVLWGEVAAKLAAEKSRAEAAEQAAAAAAATAQSEVDALEEYVGTIPASYTETSIVTYIQKVAAETLAAASGNSTETAASVAQALTDYKNLNDPKVAKNTEDIAAIVADYLKAADKTELADNIAANAEEILRIDAALKAAVENLVLVLSPFTPHICEEMWSGLGHEGTVYSVAWPTYDEAALVKDSIEIVVQINGKVKEKLQVSNNLSREDLEKEALANDKVKALVDGKNVVKVIAVPNKLVNIVIK